MSEGVKKMVKKKFPIVNIAIFILVIILFFSLFYMASYFRKQEEQIRSENPITFCQAPKAPLEEQKCYFTTHIHFFLTIKIFGEERNLQKFEYGLLNGFHTHYEENKIHWHALLLVDSVTKEPLENLTIEKLFGDGGIPFDNNKIYEFESGMLNPKTGQLAKLMIFIDSEKIENPRDYVLNLNKGHTEIEIIFE